MTHSERREESTGRREGGKVRVFGFAGPVARTGMFACAIMLCASAANAADPPAKPAETAPSEDLTTQLGGWTVTLYGQVAVIAMHDSTQSFGVASGNTMLQRRGTFRGNNDQLQLTSRDSRIGL